MYYEFIAVYVIAMSEKLAYSKEKIIEMEAFQVRTIIRKSFKAALDENDVLISPAAPSAAYKIGIANDPP